MSKQHKFQDTDRYKDPNKGRSKGSNKGPNEGRSKAQDEKEALLDQYIRQELKRRERLRKLLIGICSLFAVCGIGYFALYTFFDFRTREENDRLQALREKQEESFWEKYADSQAAGQEPQVLEEYKNLLNQNKRLIGWLKIDDTNIDYPVAQTDNNEYYLDHNLSQEYDKNGSIFMDKDCNAMVPGDNLILYGHHMKNGSMFGQLSLYESEEFFQTHRYIFFDTIYEKGTYEVMYAFRSRVYREDEIVFKYYQFIDALSRQEFESYMREMEEMSYYDTGVEAVWGDRLLTLSTCDYEVDNGRFVVVAKKIE